MKTFTCLALLFPLFALATGCDGSSDDTAADDPAGGSDSGGSNSGGSNSGGSNSGGGNSGGSSAADGGRGGEGGEGGQGGANVIEPQDIEQLPVPLGVAAGFAILASAEITNIPTSAITGNIGLTPDAGSNLSGFSMPASCPEVTGLVYAVDATGPACATIAPTLLAEAKADAAIAFMDARAATRGTPQAISGDLNGLTLYPGLYESGTSLEISPGGILYLDAQGDDTAVFIIRSATSITTESTSEVVLTDGAQASNVYWTAGSSVTLGTDSTMKGTIIGGTSISLLTGSNLEGRVLNQGTAAEAVTLDACTIVVPAP